MSSLPLTDRSVDDVADAKLRRVARKVRAVMEELDLDLGDPHLEGTELRVARAYRELFRGSRPARSPCSAPSPTSSATWRW
jgi:GTP cyclohydrolase I